MHITSLDKTEKSVPNMEGAKGVYKQVPLSARDGAPNFSFRVFTIEPGGNTPFHTHPYEHLNYIIDGSGFLVDESGEHPVSKGDFAMVMPGEKHQYRNPAKNCGNLVMICAVPSQFE
ncbi:MAG: cupin domain-containing protein [Dehalococcoidales bacterium]|jgi:quercetin dioxygenase-like cupin family protein|nr:cupin domain-containing protein [Dehalococcoidales bacterium]MDD4794659.1 cupin domain-containing protein [Dehalococcoidales bacterium]MDD5122583.1 cupin domain-containing protein [Dehalococcoidales bacterium]MDD5499017.1 cupin domain-containing protein [Dehalococcoidales bacterium]MDX9803809.1 cupin domain-containing protein [Dehalococcoidales bacterium]